MNTPFKMQQSLQSEITEIPTGAILLKTPGTDYRLFTVSFMNQAAKKILDLQGKKKYKAPIIDLLPEDLTRVLIPLWESIYRKDENNYYLKRISLSKDPHKNFLLYVADVEHGNLILLHEIQNHAKESRRLRDIAEKYRSIFEHGQDIFFQTSVDGRILEISPSVKQVAGFSHNEMIGKKVFEYYADPEDRKRFLEKLEKSGKIYDYQLKFRTKSGDYLYISTNAHIVKNSRGEVKIEGALRDITPRKQAQDRLKKSNRKLEQLNIQKDKLFSVISHDLKNALAGPSGLYDIILEDFDELDRDEIYEYLTLLNKNTKSALDLLLDLLAWSKNQFQDVKPDMTEINLSSLIQEAINSISLAADEKSITIDNQITKSCVITGDRNMLKTVFRNLLSNAIKFSYPDSKVQILGTINESDCRISIRDFGIGMDQDTVEKIFDKTVTHTVAGTNDEKGSGLGLDLCIDFVEMHHGKIWVDSEPGKGSTFHFTIPL